MIPKRVQSAMTDLSDRERTCLEGYADGYTRREIGEDLSISEETVKQYLKQAVSKLGARNSTQAAVWVALDSAVLA